MTTILALSLRAHHFTLDDPGSLEHNNWCEFLRAIWDQPGIFDVYFGKDVNSPTRVELFLTWDNVSFAQNFASTIFFESQSSIKMSQKNLFRHLSPLLASPPQRSDMLLTAAYINPCPILITKTSEYSLCEKLILRCPAKTTETKTGNHTEGRFWVVLESGRSNEPGNAYQVPIRSFDSAWIQDASSAANGCPSADSDMREERDVITLLAYIGWKSMAARDEYWEEENVRFLLRRFVTISQGFEDVQSTNPQQDLARFLEMQAPLGYQVRFLMVKNVRLWHLPNKRRKIARGCVVS